MVFVTFRSYRSATRCVVAAVLVLGGVTTAVAQPAGLPPRPLPDGPRIFETAEQPEIRLVVIARGLSHPWGLAFLPNGDLLVTERTGQLRVIRDGVLDPQAVSGVPVVHARGLAGLMDVALHPRFGENQLVYLTYSKPGNDGVRVALVRGRLAGAALVDVTDVFVSDLIGGGGTAASRVVFGTDGTLFMTVGGAFRYGAVDVGGRAQDPSDTIGKLLRLRDDGSVPSDNPFVGRDGHRPEVFSLGHRNQLGLTVHPDTGAVWAHENGPLGGDEVNLIRAGGNYGWPVVSYSRDYSGGRVAVRTWQEGMEPAEIVWLPAIAPSGMVFYDGDRFQNWRGNLFVGSLRIGGVRNTGHLQRIAFNDQGQEARRESMLAELRQRIRDVRQGPDGLLYVLTDADDGALLRLEPVE
ncbi:MAG: PQQ-dependent sugar dehydrogenase [Vicinamibacterales bacterium]|jgi:glucose/arabinose dehydrogenase|nr:PQQ-dependent sugar dehydrogenase [Vicinamibacterales bacterium]